MLFCEKTEELANRERHNNRILNKHGSTSRTYNTVEFVVLESKPFLVQSSRSNRLLLGFKCKQLKIVIIWQKIYLEMSLKIYQNQMVI